AGAMILPKSNAPYIRSAMPTTTGPASARRQPRTDCSDCDSALTIAPARPSTGGANIASNTGTWPRIRFNNSGVKVRLRYRPLHPYIYARRFDPRRLLDDSPSLLPADYRQRELFLRPAGYDLEADRKRDKWLNDKALNRTAS